MQKHIILGAVALCALAGSVRAGIIASDSYLVGSDPAAGQYQAGVVIKSQPAGLVNLGFVNGPYASGTGTSQFNLIASGSVNAAIGATAEGSGRVNYIGAALDNTYRANARNLASGAVPAGTTTVWISHLVSRADIPAAGGNGYALTGFGNTVAPDFGSTGTGSTGGLFVGFAQDGVADNFGNLVIRYRNAATANTDAVLVNGATTSTASVQYLIVMKVDINAGGGSTDNVSWWLNPTNGASEDMLTSTASATGSFGSFAFQSTADLVRLNYGAKNWNGNVYFDEPRLSTDLAGIGLAVPEPTGLTAIGLSALALLGRRRTRA